MEKSLGAKLKRLKVEVSEAKGLGVAEYKESKTYKSDLEATVGLLLAKERIKLWRFLWQVHQIEDMSILDKLNKESPFSKGDKGIEGVKEVTQEGPQASQPVV